MLGRAGTEGLGLGAVSSRSCRACSGCAAAPAPRGGARRVGSGSERARWDAQVCVGGKVRLQRPLVRQDGPGGVLLDTQARGTGE